MAVAGWERFRDKFAGYENSYTVIGGFACEILLRSEQRAFRATKDIDMIILMEDRFQEFGHIFWSFIKEGGYKCGWRQNPDLHYYRFTEPAPGYPAQIELFSRMPDYHLHTDSHIVPIHISDEISSLSAIVMDNDFYSLLQEGRIIVDGISTLNASYLIPFKMYAWIDLMEKREKGEHVNTKDLTKHKLDVFRLLPIIPNDTTVNLNGKCRESAEKYLVRIVEEPIRPEQIGLGYSFEEAIEQLHGIYQL
ncbi:MAG: hypothetical protein K6B69_04125 [Lachnospiraceae bacterium]|nr:hypothetical protein [Lachnospiraceae bacterium]